TQGHESTRARNNPAPEAGVARTGLDLVAHLPPVADAPTEQRNAAAGDLEDAFDNSELLRLLHARVAEVVGRAPARRYAVAGAGRHEQRVECARSRRELVTEPREKPRAQRLREVAGLDLRAHERGIDIGGNHAVAGKADHDVVQATRRSEHV